jgi:ribulose-bisphosphate carboxylase large chain
VRVSYLVRCGAGEIHARAESLLLEQAVELPRSSLREPEIVERILGRVEGIESRSGGTYRVTISHPLVTTAHDPAQLLNVVFGNSSLHPDVVLADVELPDAAFDWLPGPRAGIAGLRALTGVVSRVSLRPHDSGQGQEFYTAISSLPVRTCHVRRSGISHYPPVLQHSCCRQKSG